MNKPIASILALASMAVVPGCGGAGDSSISRVPGIYPQANLFVSITRDEAGYAQWKQNYNALPREQRISYCIDQLKNETGGDFMSSALLPQGVYTDDPEATPLLRRRSRRRRRSCSAAEEALRTRQDALGTDGLRPSTSSGLRPSASSGLRPSASSGLRPSASSGLRPSASSGLRPSTSSGLRRSFAKSWERSACGGPGVDEDKGGRQTKAAWSAFLLRRGFAGQAGGLTPHSIGSRILEALVAK